MDPDLSAGMPSPTIKVFARSIASEAYKYGFSDVDSIRLINELIDAWSEIDQSGKLPIPSEDARDPGQVLTALPLKGKRVIIRNLDPAVDLKLFSDWLLDSYGRFFLLSCSTAQSDDIEAMVADPGNHFGIITTLDGQSIGALAFLDHNMQQSRAELRKLIGNRDFRGKGYAEEATRLWVRYGIEGLGLRKIFVSTLQTHLANIRLNEAIGFRVEGLLRDEVCVDGRRHDVLRMGISV